MSRRCLWGDAADAVRQAEAALQQGKTLILFNPLLRDVASPDGVMGVRSAHPPHLHGLHQLLCSAERSSDSVSAECPWDRHMSLYSPGSEGQEALCSCAVPSAGQ